MALCTKHVQATHSTTALCKKTEGPRTQQWPCVEIMDSSSGQALPCLGMHAAAHSCVGTLAHPCSRPTFSHTSVRLSPPPPPPRKRQA
eukprot:1158209-Pelagomonas_calceolata.AAC.14